LWYSKPQRFSKTNASVCNNLSVSMLQDAYDRTCQFINKWYPDASEALHSKPLTLDDQTKLAYPTDEDNVFTISGRTPLWSRMTDETLAQTPFQFWGMVSQVILSDYKIRLPPRRWESLWHRSDTLESIAPSQLQLLPRVSNEWALMTAYDLAGLSETERQSLLGRYTVEPKLVPPRLKNLLYLQDLIIWKQWGEQHVRDHLHYVGWQVPSENEAARSLLMVYVRFPHLANFWFSPPPLSKTSDCHDLLRGAMRAALTEFDRMTPKSRYLIPLNVRRNLSLLGFQFNKPVSRRQRISKMDLQPSNVMKFSLSVSQPEPPDFWRLVAVLGSCRFNHHTSPVDYQNRFSAFVAEHNEDESKERKRELQRLRLERRAQVAEEKRIARLRRQQERAHNKYLERQGRIERRKQELEARKERYRRKSMGRNGLEQDVDESDGTFETRKIQRRLSQRRVPTNLFLFTTDTSCLVESEAETAKQDESIWSKLSDITKEQ
jgi:hypothetical protein